MSNELLSINVNDHTEKKGQLTYLSWAWAWAEVLKFDPLATWVVHNYGPEGSQQPCMWVGDTAMVHTSVTVNGLRRECLLPVMDNKNNAVKNPDARKISDAIMRCMTKAIAMHGLGLYIYAGEDLPQVEGDSRQDARQHWLDATALSLESCNTPDELKAAWAAAVKTTRAEEDTEAYETLKPIMERMAAHIIKTAQNVVAPASKP